MLPTIVSRSETMDMCQFIGEAAMVLKRLYCGRDGELPLQFDAAEIRFLLYVTTKAMPYFLSFG